jgi:hypothetical protein
MCFLDVVSLDFAGWDALRILFDIADVEALYEIFET